MGDDNRGEGMSMDCYYSGCGSGEVWLWEVWFNCSYWGGLFLIDKGSILFCKIYSIASDLIY
jgi:hypothetical protein